MVFTGLDYRYFTDLKTGTFVFQGLTVSGYSALNGTTTSGREFRIGLTGIHANTGWYFAFRNGNIYDPEGRFFGSYNPEDSNTISGNFVTGIYDYYLNNTLVCSIGQYSGFDVNGWFTQCISGATATGSIAVYSPVFPMSLTFATGFTQGGTWTGTFSHNNCGPLVIRSGALFLPDADYFTLDNSLNFNTGTNVLQPNSGLRITLTNTGISDRTGVFTVGLYIYTDFGVASYMITGSAGISGSGYVGNSFSSTSGAAVTTSGSGFTGFSGAIFSTSFTDISGGALPAPFYVELSYVSGITGLFSWVTGIFMSNSGSGYTSQPIITVTPTASGFPMASGSGLISAGHITGVTWVITGIYPGYTGQYNLTIVGGGGSFATGTPLFASGYQKSFTGNINLTTGNYGVDSGIIPSFNQTTYSGFATGVSGITVAFMDINIIGTPDTSPITWLLKASGLPDSTTFLSMYSGSGVAYRY